MRTNDLIIEIQRLPIQKRMFVIEKTIHSLRKHESTNEMKRAASALFSDYLPDNELVAFTNLYFEVFYETR